MQIILTTHRMTVTMTTISQGQTLFAQWVWYGSKTKKWTQNPQLWRLMNPI